MASSSSKALMLSSSSSSHRVMYNGKWEYDVFVCFRGADTRNSFTSHLMEALSREEIKAFIDDMLEKTESIGELISVLQRSALSIVIFSENFADSSWCLDEVATISQIMEEFGHRVLPIFYKVDPSDVSEDCGSYAATINLKYGASNVPEDRKRWMGALKAVANCTGHTSQEIKIDSELVKVIVSDVLKRLVHMSPRVKSDMLIGMDARICEVEKLLALNVNDFRIIGLWGMGGVGKTTLARACYQRFTSSTKGTKRQFVRNIHQTCEKENGMVGIMQELYSALLSEDNISYEDLDVSYRRDRLSRLKVFLVFDDVETFSELEHLLLGDLLNTFNLFALGSRIIVTTRNRRVLENARANIYYVEGLHSQESLQLFGIHAFRQYLPPDDWMRLSAVAISYCKGSPLAIKVLGGTLYCRDKSYWESFLCELRKIPKPEIHDVLRRSYDELGIVEKRLFLDTACFLHRQRKNLVMKYFSIGYQCANYVLEDLIGKSLLVRVSSEDYENIEVHDLLREMAWNIVNEESELANRSRLNNADDIRKILTIRKVKTEGISLNLFKANEMYLEATTFEGMTSLRFLCFVYFSEEHGIRKVHLPSGGLDMLPDSLRWLLWDGFPSKSLPSRFSPENLVLLAIRHSPFIERCWEVQPKLVNLVELHLSDCINLTDVPDLSSSPNLEYLYLQGCKSLIELPSHIQYLNKLITLDLGDCINLQSLPVKLNSKFLEHVYLSNCPMVIRCPEINSRLVHLDLMETPVTVLPGAIFNVKQGSILRLCGKHITSFPAISANLNLFRLCHTTIREMESYDEDHLASSELLLPRFVQLELVDNPQLKSLSMNIWTMVSQTLVLDDCPLIESLPEVSQPVNGLTELQIFKCGNLESFPAGINNLRSLQALYFCATDITSLPACIQELDQLSLLDLSFSKSLELVPSAIYKLAKLSSLYLTGCLMIQSLPELPPNLILLDVSGCKLLQALPSNLGKLRWKYLCFDDCPRLDKNLPKEMVQNFPIHATLYLHPRGDLQYSGSEIPDWFAYNKNDSCVMVQLPLPNSSKQPIKGIAFGVVCSSDVWIDWLDIKCDCNIGTLTAASWSSHGLHLDGTASEDNVYLWYDENLLVETKQRILEEAEIWYVKYAGLTVTFRFYFEAEKEDVEKLKSTKIKRVGLSLLY